MIHVTMSSIITYIPKRIFLSNFSDDIYICKICLPFPDDLQTDLLIKMYKIIRIKVKYFTNILYFV